MQIFHGTENANIARPTVLTLGVFDGLHLGHQAIMKTVVDRASGSEAVPTVITFDPHPRAVLHPDSAPPMLQTLDQRLANFNVLGIEQAIVIRFTKEFADQEAEEFLREIVHERLQAKEIYLGHGFAFGKGRRGDIELLRKMSGELGFTADEVPEVRLRGIRISSSRIRQLLKDGQVNLARRMLGRPYGIEGVIIRGHRRGHTIGFPTANLKPENRVVPKFGVYATATLIEGVWKKGVTNIGIRPTFESESEPSIETHIFDFEGDLYGSVLRVRFLHRIRPEKKFSGIEDLRDQIARDVETAKRYFRREGVMNCLELE